MKLTAVAAKQSIKLAYKKWSIKCVQTNTKDLSGTAIAKIMKLLKTVSKQITILVGIRKKLLIGKAGYILGRSKNSNHINTMS